MQLYIKDTDEKQQYSGESTSMQQTPIYALYV